MSTSDFRVIADKVFEKLMEEFPVKQVLNSHELMGVGPQVVKGRPVNKNQDDDKKFNSVVDWLLLNGYLSPSGDFYTVSEKWLAAKGVDVFS
ncbi:hypothetical protein ACP4J5_15135 [Pseudomonas oryzihabitans]|uniref:hypothetical protein n=1 Tax=Pseudomonas oryzihabitans TaxID=47885 RepID=UPI003CF49FF1